MYYSESSTEEARRLAAELYADNYRHLLRIARRNAASEADAEDATQDAFTYFLADYDPAAGSPPLAWLTLTLKRRCWRLRDAAHLDRRVVAEAGAEYQEPTATVDSVGSDAELLVVRVADCDGARRRMRALKPDERTAIGMVAAGCTYEEVGKIRGWTQTKVNRCVYEGRLALRREVAR